jgi:hypothetical protein
MYMVYLLFYQHLCFATQGIIIIIIIIILQNILCIVIERAGYVATSFPAVYELLGWTW